MLPFIIIRILGWHEPIPTATHTPFYPLSLVMGQTQLPFSGSKDGHQVDGPQIQGVPGGRWASPLRKGKFSLTGLKSISKLPFQLTFCLLTYFYFFLQVFFPVSPSLMLLCQILPTIIITSSPDPPLIRLQSRENYGVSQL